MRITKGKRSLGSGDIGTSFKCVHGCMVSRQNLIVKRRGIHCPKSGFGSVFLQKGTSRGYHLHISPSKSTKKGAMLIAPFSYVLAERERFELSKQV